MDAVTKYILDFISTGDKHLDRISRQEELRQDVQPSVGAEVGRFLSLLVRLMQAKRVLELGTSLGYSAVCLAQALKVTGGRLTSIERDKGRCLDAQKNVSAAGLSDVVELLLGDAAVLAGSLQGPFDLILQDSDKALYPKLLDRCIDLTREYGVIVADDTLFKPRGISEKFSAPVHRYNEMVFAEPRLFSTILPIGDGITISVKMTGRHPRRPPQAGR